MSLLKNPLMQFIFSYFIADKNIGQGAATTLFCALSPSIVSGGYYSDCALGDADAEGTDADQKLRRALWAATEADVSAAVAAGVP